MTRRENSVSEPSTPVRDPALTRRFLTVIVSHPILDAYAGFVPPLLAVLQVRCDLSPWQTASLLSIGSLTSGLCQPLFAWLTDHIDSRLFGTSGLAVAAAALSCVGLAHDFASLVVLFVIGMLGVGAFHPVAAASVGQLSGTRRSAGVSVFFVAGMVGATVGPLISTRVAAIEPDGFDLLRWAMIPGLLAAALLHTAIRDVPHRHHEHRAFVFTPMERRRRLTATLLLFAGNAVRYSLHLASLYLYVWWAAAVVSNEQPHLTGDALVKGGAVFCGELNACLMAGMGLGGLLTGVLVRTGREKWPIVLLPVLFAPALGLLPFSGRLGGYALVTLAGVGFSALIPVTISVAQRLMPNRTSLASSLMMGAAWAIAAVGPPIAEWSLESFGMARTFVLAAIVLAGSGALGLPIRSALLRSTS